jgi:hypothetical protein
MKTFVLCAVANTLAASFTPPAYHGKPKYTYTMFVEEQRKIVCAGVVGTKCDFDFSEVLGIAISMEAHESLAVISEHNGDRKRAREFRRQFFKDQAVFYRKLNELTEHYNDSP